MPTNPAQAPALLLAAQRGDERAYRALVEPHHARLRAHCYRMLGSLADADDAVQETLLGAWQGISSFEGRSSLRTWLFTVATHACLRLATRRRSRRLPDVERSAADPGAELEPALDDDRWLEPYPDHEVEAGVLSPEARYEEMESVELAFVAALQSLPATQRAVLILRDVLGFSADETAASLDTSVGSANSALQRARETLTKRLPAESEQRTRSSLGDENHRALVERFIAAWRRADVDAIVAMLTDDAVFTMPPLPAWFQGRDAIAVFLRTRVFELRWQFAPCGMNGQPAMAAYRWNEPSGAFELEVVNVFTLRGDRVGAITAFTNAAVCRRLGLPLVV